jgi:hypothetical protein
MVSLIFRTLLIFSLFAINLEGEIYIFSYKIVTKDSKVAVDSLYVSELMTNYKKFRGVSSIEVEGSVRDSDRLIIERSKDQILEWLLTQNAIIEDHTRTSNLQGRSQTTLLLPPQYIALERVNGSLFMTLLDEI